MTYLFVHSVTVVIIINTYYNTIVNCIHYGIFTVHPPSNLAFYVECVIHEAQGQSRGSMQAPPQELGTSVQRHFSAEN